MTIEVNLTQLIVILIAAISGIWTLFKVLAVQNQRFFVQQFATHEKNEFDFHQNQKKELADIKEMHRMDAHQWQRVERELLTLKADLPLHYVRREDYVQAIATVMVKLDAAALRHENLFMLLKGVHRES